MLFYRLKLREFRRIEFACRVRKFGYKNRFPHTEGLLEISITTDGEIIRRYENGETESVPVGSVSTITRDLTCLCYARAEEVQEHITVGVTAEYDYSLIRSEEADLDLLSDEVSRGECFLLPHILPLAEDLNAVENDIERIIAYNTSIGLAGRLKANAAFYALLARLTEVTLSRLFYGSEHRTDAAERYVREAKAYIKNNYRSQIRVGDIAKELGISAGYLHSIFKTSVGMSPVEYANQYRVRLAVQYIKSRNFSLKEAAYEVGIEDPSYMSRLFKRVTGVSYRRFIESGEGDT